VKKMMMEPAGIILTAMACSMVGVAIYRVIKGIRKAQKEAKEAKEE